MSTTSVSGNSSSSQSSSVSWQPSQLENFQTASRGRPAPEACGWVRSLISALPYGQQRRCGLPVDDRPVDTGEQRPELAVTAVSGPALHVALE